MIDVALGQFWEVYSDRENRWVPAVIVKQDDQKVTLRYQGFLELFTLSVEDLQTKSDRFRVVD